jgi:hypothetical protein
MGVAIMLNLEHLYLPGATPNSHRGWCRWATRPGRHKLFASAATTATLVQDESDVKTLMDHRRHIPSTRAQRYAEVAA